MVTSASKFICLITLALPWVLAQTDHKYADRREYCSRGNLCLTSFDWCRRSVEEPYSTACDYSAIRYDDNFYIAQSLGYPVGDVGIYYGPTYNLTWVNADPNYPVRVQWLVGPDEGPINKTVPVFETNITSLSYFVFKVYDVLDAIRVQKNISSYSDIGGYAQGWFTHFNISQPERPISTEVNTTDQSDAFNLYTNLQYTLRSLRMTAEQSQADAQADLNKKWSIGVGVGVGVGVPLLLITAYLLGSRSGKKAAGVSDTAITKDTSNLSDKEQSVVGTKA